MSKCTGVCPSLAVGSWSGGNIRKLRMTLNFPQNFICLYHVYVTAPPTFDIFRRQKGAVYSTVTYVYFNLVHCSFIFGHGWLHSNQFCKTCQNWFCPSWCCLCCMMAFAGAFTTKQQLIHPALLCVLWQNLDEDTFDKLYKNDCWAAIPDPIWTTNVPYERKINMLSSTDNNFIICLFDFWEI